MGEHYLGKSTKWESFQLATFDFFRILEIHHTSYLYIYIHTCISLIFIYPYNFIISLLFPIIPYYSLLFPYYSLIVPIIPILFPNSPCYSHHLPHIFPHWVSRARDFRGHSEVAGRASATWRRPPEWETAGGDSKERYIPEILSIVDTLL